MILRDVPYAANRREFTPAIPMRGLAIPGCSMLSEASQGCMMTIKPLYSARMPSLRIVCFTMSIGPFYRVSLEHDRRVSTNMTHKHFRCQCKPQINPCDTFITELGILTGRSLSTGLDGVQRLPDDNLGRPADTPCYQLVNGISIHEEAPKVKL